MSRFNSKTPRLLCLVVLSVSLCLAGCSSGGAVAMKAASLVSKTCQLFKESVRPADIRLGSHLDEVDVAIRDLRSIPNPSSAERSALSNAEDLKLYLNSVDEVVRIADDSASSLSAKARTLVANSLATSTPEEKFVIDLRSIGEEMLKSTTCGVAEELMTPLENSKAVDLKPTYNRKAAVTGVSNEALNRAREFIMSRLTDLNWDVSGIDKIFPTIAFAKRVYDVADGLRKSIEGVSEAHNPATSRGWVAYSRYCTTKILP